MVMQSDDDGKDFPSLGFGSAKVGWEASATEVEAGPQRGRPLQLAAREYVVVRR